MAASLVKRALVHSRGRADSVRLHIDAIAESDVVRGELPGLKTVQVDDFETGRRAASSLLRLAGISDTAIAVAMRALSEGPAPGGKAMRGAMLIDGQTGERLESDAARGVRVSRLGMTAETRKLLCERLERLGLNNAHVREALTLAAKVMASGGVAAELCWSDDPEYTAGYVAAAPLGYVRFPHLKPLNVFQGGRAFFLKEGIDSIPGLIRFLETTPWLACETGVLREPVTLEAFYASLGV